MYMDDSSIWCCFQPSKCNRYRDMRYNILFWDTVWWLFATLALVLISWLMRKMYISSCHLVKKCTCECLYLQYNVDPIENSCRENTATKTVQTSNASNCSRFYLTESNLFNQQNIMAVLDQCSDIIVDKFTEPCDLFKISLDEQIHSCRKKCCPSESYLDDEQNSMVGLKCGSDICLTDITLNEKIINRQNIGSDNTIVTKCTEHCDYLKTSFDKQEYSDDSIYEELHPKSVCRTVNLDYDKHQDTQYCIDRHQFNKCKLKKNWSYPTVKADMLQPLIEKKMMIILNSCYVFIQVIQVIQKK